MGSPCLEWDGSDSAAGLPGELPESLLGVADDDPAGHRQHQVERQAELFQGHA
ncbi:TPA: hypothetical protein U2R02_006218, partial [Klebsiella michiganensis]|nr:hypothetical protein [Klebsiella michiganensis]